MIEKVISDFGKTFGFKDLKFNDEKLIHLSIENKGDFYIEDIAPNLIIYAIRKVDSIDTKIIKKALTLCHYRELKPFNVDTGILEDDKLAFSIRLDHEDVTPTNLGKAYDFLDSIHTKIQKISQ